MHELGIVFHIIESLEKVGKENQLKQIGAVTLEIGEVSSVIDTYLSDCWKWAVNRSDLLRDAELNIEKIPAVTRCGDCRKTYPTVQYGKTCPNCGSTNTCLVSGNEVNIKEIMAC